MQDSVDNITIYKQTSTKTPQVSILCSTYNQELYISQTLESFLSQETSFDYEIVVHDDASTDSTPRLLKDFYKRYSDKITVILQHKNQYSKGHFEPVLIEAKHAQAPVFFLCDGDDYWISKNKLQYQLERYQAHPNIDLVFHPVFKEFPDNSRVIYCRHSEEEWIVPTNKLIKGTGGFCPTTSLLISKKALLSMPDNLVQTMPVGDAFIQIYGALNGGALYIPEIMAVYRIHSTSSVSGALSKASVEAQRNFNFGMAKAYELLRKELPLRHFFALTKMERKYRIKKNRKLDNKTKIGKAYGK
jgi:glycosyltransferase involved in cell wall biosynthesis